MTDRRRVSFLALLALAGTALPVHADELRFRVYLGDTPIGWHRYTIQRTGETWRVESEAKFTVTLLNVTIYRYAHHASEEWRDGCLVRLSARTDENGKPRQVDATLREGQLDVTSNRGAATLSGCVMSYAYWNPQFVRASHVLNAQTGEYQAIKVATPPDTPVPSDLPAAAARHYRVDTGKHEIDLWYDGGGRWLALESDAALGRRIRYRPE